MLNRPIHNWDAGATEDGWWNYARDVDRLPWVRLIGIYLALVLPLVLIGMRVAYLQLQLPQVYAAEFKRTTEEFEEIFAPNGRILSSEGDVLAEDVREYTLTVYYQYLAETPDPGWIKQQVRARLSPSERRKPELVEHATQQVLAERQQMWDRLLAIPGLNPEAMIRARETIQSRIAHMRDSVLQRREQRRLEQAQTLPFEQSTPDSTTAKLWQGVVSALSTPPERTSEHPLVLQEELDYHLIAESIPADVARGLIVQSDKYPGVLIRQTTHREYPEHDLAAHAVGYRRPLSAEEHAARVQQFPQGDPLGYQAGEWVGRTGLEKQYERHLRGLNGRRRLVLNRRGEILRTEIVREERPGRDLELSLSAKLQRLAEKLLDEALNGATDATEKPETLLPVKPPLGGSIVVLDARTGEVLTLAAAPRFDVNLFIRNDTVAWEQVTNDPRHPLFARATQMTLPPGSTFKVVSATAFLSSGKISPTRPVDCQGFLHVPTKDRCLVFAHFGVGHGPMDLTQALAKSCNVYFYQGAEAVGGRTIAHWARQFGLGQSTGIDLPGEKGGHVPLDPRGQRTAWNPGDTRHLAIGQSTLVVTPLQMARQMAVIANGGQLVTPRIARSLNLVLDEGTDSGTRPDRTFLPVPPPQSIPGLESPEVLSWVRRGMEAVVGNPGGTAYKTVRLPEVAIAGKTGTAEAGGGRPDHAWFAGYVPADQPRYAFVVVLEHAGSGGKVAGPVARKLVQGMLTQGLLERQGTRQELTASP